MTAIDQRVRTRPLLEHTAGNREARRRGAKLVQVPRTAKLVVSGDVMHWCVTPVAHARVAPPHKSAAMRMTHSTWTRHAPNASTIAVAMPASSAGAHRYGTSPPP